MLQRFINWIRGVIARMFHIDDAKRTLGTDIAISQKMQEAIDLWSAMFLDSAPWLTDDVESMDLPASIAEEFARLITVEFQSSVEGSARADWLNGEYADAVLEHLKENVETAAAVGGVVFKPYVDGDRIAVDAVPAWRFLPTAFNSRKEITGAVFVEIITRGKVRYTRMEQHQLTDAGYNIRNLAFASQSEGSLGTPCALVEVEEWADLEPDITIRYKDGSAPERVLFAYYKIPLANNIDPDSPLGVSVYARATNLIKDADEQYSRIRWEYKGTELAIDASAGALKKDAGGNWNMPQHQRRLFRELALDRGDNGDLYEVFSPAIRDASLFNGLDKILKRVEFSCGLAYGTLSDPQSVEKTAEEIRTSKQRSYAAVCMMQSALQKALEHLVWAMDFYATMYNLAPRGEYEVSFSFGDGVLEDADKEFATRKSLVDAGYLKPEALVAWYFGTSEEEARKMMPGAEPALELG